MVYARVVLLLAILAIEVEGFIAQMTSTGHVHQRIEATTAACTDVEFGGMQHAGVLVRDTQVSKRFFIDVLGFADETYMRPTTLPFDGAFVRAGAHQIHLMELPNPDPTEGRPEHGGRDRHTALTVRKLEPLKARLEKAGVIYTMSKGGRAALFCRDPDGNAFEFIETDF